MDKFKAIEVVFQEACIGVSHNDDPVKRHEFRSVADALELAWPNVIAEYKQRTIVPLVPVESDKKRSHLTEREREVLKRLAAGLPNKEIGRDMKITEATVKVHVKNILRIMNVKNRTQAAIKAAEYAL